jgi:hypothetical protein
MIWLTWRQFRTQAVVVFGGVAILAVVLAATGPRLVHLHHTQGDRFIDGLSGTDSGLYVLAWLAVLALPALIGMFWGAPLVTRELDAGTHRLAWTQTTRTRWLVTKLALIGLAAVIATGLLSLAVSWWAAPIDAAVASRNGMPGPGVFFPRLSRLIFDARGLVPAGYAAFAFVLGVTLGVVIRRTLPAMALMLAVFVAVQVVVSVWVRPHLLAPEHQTIPITAENLIRIDMSNNLHVLIDRPGAWITAQHTVNAAGHPARPPSWAMTCPEQKGGLACFTRLNSLGYRQLVYYQPAGRFWALQWYETTIYLALALALAGLSTWWTRHRLS